MVVFVMGLEVDCMDWVFDCVVCFFVLEMVAVIFFVSGTRFEAVYGTVHFTEFSDNSILAAVAFLPVTITLPDTPLPTTLYVNLWAVRLADDLSEVWMTAANCRIAFRYVISGVESVGLPPQDLRIIDSTDTVRLLLFTFP